MFGKQTGRGGHHTDAERFAGPVGAGGNFRRGGGWADDRGDGGGRGRGRGPGRRRMFDNGQLRLVLLRLIADEPRHGYELIRALEERTGGAYAPSPGVVYPTLTLLAETGLAHEQASEGPRKLYAITDEGNALLTEQAEEVNAIFARLDKVGEVRGRVEAAPLRRAMHNLRAVLEHRFADELEKDRLHEAVALIDEVAGKIERL